MISRAAGIAALAAPAALIAATFSARPLPVEEGPLEPSVQNEVDVAVDRAERWLSGEGAAATNAPVALWFSTNDLTRAALAVRLVSQQRGAGWWLTPTNSAPTRLALDILKRL